MSTLWIRDANTGEYRKEEKPGKQLALFKEPDPIELKEAHASMSKSALVLSCQWWINRQVPEEIPSGAALYGRAAHELIAARIISPPKKITSKKIAKKHSTEADPIDAKALKKHVNASLAYLIGWLKGENPYGVNFVKRAQARTEQSFSYNVATKRVHSIVGPTADHHVYKDLTPEEFPGTADLVIDKMVTKKDAPDLIVIDHKTGEHVELPKHSAQLKSLMLAASIRVKAKRVAGGIFHTPREGAPFLYVDEFERDELAEHGEKLKKAWGGIGAGSLTPGPWCPDCPAFSICPVHTSAISALEKVGLSNLTPELIGRVHMVGSAYAGWWEKFKETTLRPYVVKHGPVPRPDGKLLQLKKQPLRNLSLSSIERKLGKVAGAKRIQELDDEGLIEHLEIEKLVAVADK